MKKRFAIAVSAFLVVVAACWLALRSHTAQAAEPVASAAVRQGVELTVYAEDFGLVRESRPQKLAAGSNSLQVTDVSKQMDPQSVLLKWQAGGGSAPELVAHAYDLGVSGEQALLKRYLGKEVEVVRYSDTGHESERQKGRLMVGEGGVVVQTEGKFYLQPPGTIVAPANPDVVTIPQLSVQAVSKAAQTANLEVAYLTRGLSWSADYVGTLSPKDDSLSLECWATVVNRTGVDYPSAKVSLIAGTPNRAAVPARQGRQVMGFADGNTKYLAKAGEEYNFDSTITRPRTVSVPESVGDFYSYPVKNPTTVHQEQMNRLLMLSSEKVGTIRDYSATLPALGNWEYGEWPTGSTPKRGHVQVALTFFNKDKEGLGQPLPHGAIRLYEPDAAGSLRYAGAANILDTPKDQKVNITLSNAFDLFTERRIVSWKRINKRTIQKAVELVLHNEKKAPAELRIVQPIANRWEIVTESHKHAKLDASNVQWKIPVPAGGTTRLEFKVNLSE